MFALNEEQVAFILKDIAANGIELEELQLSLLDHICCLVEEEMLPDSEFEIVYRNILPRFFEKELIEIQKETELLLTFKNYYTMKKVMLNTGIFSAFVFTIGAIFKFMHWPGANIMLLLPIAAISFIFLPLLFVIKSKEKTKLRDKTVVGVGVIFGIILSMSTTFKVMHWPGANMLWMVALAFLFFVFLPIFFFSGIRNPEAKTNTIISSILILMAGGLFFTLTDLSGTKQKMDDIILQTDLQIRVTSDFMNEQNQIKYGLVADSLQISKNETLKLKCDSLCESIEQMKLTLMQKVPGQPMDSEEEFVRVFGYDITRTTRILFNEDNRPKPILTGIKNRIADLNAFINANYNSVNSLLNVSDNTNTTGKNKVNESWEIANFHKVQPGFIMRYLNLLILDIRITEARYI